MQSKSFFYIAIFTLTLVGAWGVVHISKQTNDTEPGPSSTKHQQADTHVPVNDVEDSLINDDDNSVPSTSAIVF